MTIYYLFDYLFSLADGKVNVARDNLACEQAYVLGARARAAKRAAEPLHHSRVWLKGEPARRLEMFFTKHQFGGETC